MIHFGFAYLSFCYVTHEGRSMWDELMNLNWMNFADEHQKAIAVLTWSGWFTHDVLSFPIMTVSLKLSHWAYVLSDKLGLTGCLILW